VYQTEKNVLEKKSRRETILSSGRGRLKRSGREENGWLWGDKRSPIVRGKKDRGGGGATAEKKRVCKAGTLGEDG